MKKLIFAGLLGVLLVQIGFSQPDKLFWRNPSLKDLYMKQCPEDPSAPAMILEEYGYVYFDQWREELKMFYQIRRRIKIFTEAGKKYAHFEKIYYSGYDYFEEFASIKAYIYTIQNGRPVKKRLRRKYIKTIKLADGYRKLVIDFPTAKPGDIVEYRLTFTTFLFADPMPWKFQHEIPTRLSKFEMTVPHFATYYFNVVGNNYLTKDTAEPGYTSIQWTTTLRDPIPPGLNYPSTSTTGTFNFKLECTYYTFEMKDIPAFYPENYLDNPQNYYYQVQPLLAYLKKDYGYFDDLHFYLWQKFSNRLFQTLVTNYKPLTRTEAENAFYPSGYIVFNATDWNNFAKSMRKNRLWWLQMQRFIEGTPPVQNLIKGRQSDTAKIKAIYNWIAQNLKWNGIYNAYPDHKLKKVVKNHAGNSAEINMLFINLCRRAGIKAYPVLVKTVDRGHLIPQLAANYQFNHLIALLKLKSGERLFDATSKNPLLLLDSISHNQLGFVIEQDSNYFYQLNDPVKHINSYNLTLNFQNNTLTGNIKHTLTGRNIFDNKLKGSKNNFQGIEDSKTTIQLTSTKQTYDTYTEEYTLNSSQLCTANDSILIIEPLKFFRVLANEFTDENRKYPLYLFNNYEIDINLTIKNLDNYIAQKLPDFFKPINDATLSVKSQFSNGNLVLSLKFKLKNYLIQPENYASFYQLNQTLENFRQVKTVLKKAK